ncbi:MAG TPA: hypothetical protein VEC19_16730 [Usitatibacter sp.]|nr:hypothetical protein [Usitatibacter sp.]
MKRTPISPGRLFRLMSESFTARRPAGCDRCRMPLPYLIERPDEVSANWRIGTPPTCPLGCNAVIIDIAAELWPKYDLVDGFAGNEPYATRASDATRHKD